MRRIGSQAGLTVLELVIAAALSAGVFLAAGRMLDASNNVAQSTTDAGTAQRRVDSALGEVADTIRIPVATGENTSARS